ncbi:hypothetical protein C8R46DRAFT_1226040 [Mycena filopes]|nr:hypothetical protein C8R46DRAFT_1226040 [Mycena filopes]
MPIASTTTYPALTPVEERKLCVAFFGLSLYKNGHQEHELDVGKQRVKRAKITPACSLRSSSHSRHCSSALADDEMDVESPSRVFLKRSAPDDDELETVDAPPLKRVKAPFFLADCPLVNNGPLATVTFTELVVVVNAYDGLSDGQKAGLDAWNARCNGGHLSEHAPAAVRAPVTVTIKITELRYKPYEALGEDAKRAWDKWNARCEAAGRSSFEKSEKALGKRRAVEPLVDVTNLGRSGRKAQTKNKGRRENAPYARSSRALCLALVKHCLLQICWDLLVLGYDMLDSNPTVLTASSTDPDTAGRDDPGGRLAGVVLLLACGWSLARFGARLDLLDPEYVLLVSSSTERTLTSTQTPTVFTPAAFRIPSGVTTPAGAWLVSIAMLDMCLGARLRLPRKPHCLYYRCDPDALGTDDPARRLLVSMDAMLLDADE